MKLFKKLLTIAIALMMVLGLGTRVMAAESPLTVSGLAEGDVAHFYKVLEWAPDDDNSVKGWKAVAPFDTILDKAKLTEVLVGIEDDPATTETDESQEPTLITSELAGQLARVEGINAVADVTVAEDETSAQYTNTTGTGAEQKDVPGLWMVLITPSDPDTVYNPVFVASDFVNQTPSSTDWQVDAVTETYSDHAATKKSTVTLDKTASTTEDTWDDKQWTTTAIGDTVSFTVTTTIPGYGEVYQNPVFKITDKLTDLELTAGTVTVYDNTNPDADPPVVIDADKYTLTENPNLDGYKIEFKTEYLKTLKTPLNIKVTYDAIVTTEAPVHVNTEKNEVSTEFSHNPSDENDHSFKKDDTVHYTFTIDANGLGGGEEYSGKKTSEIVKVGVDANGQPINKEDVKVSDITEENTWTSPLAGAEFKLYTDKACKNEYIPKKSDGTAGSALEIKSGADGRMTIKGLDAGTYYLREETAPAGFVKDSHVAEIVISAETEPKNITEYTTDGVTWISQEAYDDLEADVKKNYKSYTYSVDVLKSYEITIDGEVTASYTFTNKGTDPVIVWSETGPIELPHQFTNAQGTELPSTGGMGTTLFYTIGGMLVIGAGILLVSRRRMAE